MDEEYRPKYILIHHSATVVPTPQFDAINEWHRQRNFPKSELGFYVGYHRVIEMNGEVKVARGDFERDCDATGHNFDSLSVCLVGDFTKCEPTPEQINSLGELLAEWVKKHNINPTLIYPHRHFGNTSCYGGKLENTWGTLVCLSHLALKAKWF